MYHTVFARSVKTLRKRTHLASRLPPEAYTTPPTLPGGPAEKAPEGAPEKLRLDVDKVLRYRALSVRRGGPRPKPRSAEETGHPPKRNPRQTRVNVLSIYMIYGRFDLLRLSFGYLVRSTILAMPPDETS